MFDAHHRWRLVERSVIFRVCSVSLCNAHSLSADTTRGIYNPRLAFYECFNVQLVWALQKALSMSPHRGSDPRFDVLTVTVTFIGSICLVELDWQKERTSGSTLL